MDIDDFTPSRPAASNAASAASAASSTPSAAALSELKEVSVRFFTRHPSLPQVPNTFLNVPVKLARYGLSEIVNALTETSPPRPFDFLIGGRFLRSDLLTFLQSNAGVYGIEKGLEIEYVAAAPEPQSEDAQPHPDWIASLSATHPSNFFVVTGCFDSTVRIFDTRKPLDAPPAAIGVGHDSAVKSVSVFRHAPSVMKEEDASGGTMSVQIVSGSKDRSVRVWKYTPSSTHMRCVAVCDGHTDSVETVTTSEGTDRFFSGGWDHTICMWDLTDADTKLDSDNVSNGGTTKKRKTNASASAAASAAQSSAATPASHAPVSRLGGHIGAVTTLVSPHPTTLYSGSMDHSIRCWDLATGQTSASWFAPRVITGLDYSLAANLLVTSHQDKLVRTWDPRQSSKENVKHTLRSHKGWVSCVKFAPHSSNLLATGSYDHTVKVWDLRATLPLFTLQRHSDKVMTLDWMMHAAESTLWSGGADQKLQRHVMKKEDGEGNMQE